MAFWGRPVGLTFHGPLKAQSDAKPKDQSRWISWVAFEVGRSGQASPGFHGPSFSCLSHLPEPRGSRQCLTATIVPKPDRSPACR